MSKIMAKCSNLYTEYLTVINFQLRLICTQVINKIIRQMTNPAMIYNLIFLCFTITQWSVQSGYEMQQDKHSTHLLHLYMNNNNHKSITLPNCLMSLNLWNCGVSIIFTSSGWSSMQPYKGS